MDRKASGGQWRGRVSLGMRETTTTDDGGGVTRAEALHWGRLARGRRAWRGARARQGRAQERAPLAGASGRPRPDGRSRSLTRPCAPRLRGGALRERRGRLERRTEDVP